MDRARSVSFAEASNGASTGVHELGSHQSGLRDVVERQAIAVTQYTVRDQHLGYPSARERPRSAMWEYC